MYILHYVTLHYMLALPVREYAQSPSCKVVLEGLTQAQSSSVANTTAKYGDPRHDETHIKQMRRHYSQSPY